MKTILYSLVLVLTLSFFNSPAKAGDGDYELDHANYNVTVSSYYGFTLSVPRRLGTEIPVIKGILVSAPGDGAYKGQAPSGWDRWLYDHNFAWVGINTPNDDGNTIIAALDSFAVALGRPELHNAPVCIGGMSRGGFMTINFTCSFPDRTISFLACHGSPDYFVNEKGFGVPGMFTDGELDGDNYSNWFWGAYTAGRSKGALWAEAIDWSRSHPDVPHETDFALEYFDALIELRYPKDGNPLNGPVKLNALTESDGWLGEHRFGALKLPSALAANETLEGHPNLYKDFETPFAYIAPYAEFDRSPKTDHSWFPNERIATLWRAHVSGKGFTTVNMKSPDFALTDRSLSYFDYASYSPGFIFNTDQSIDVVVKTDGFADANKVEFYAGATKMGEDNTAPYEFTYTFPHAGIYNLYAIVSSSCGEKRVTYHNAITIRPNVLGDNHTPTCTKIANQAITDGGTLELPFTISDAETSADNLTIDFRSFGSNLSASITGSGADRKLNLSIPAGYTGTTGGILRVSDGTLSVNEYVEIKSITSTNTAPSIDGGRSISFEKTYLNMWTRPCFIKIGDAETDPTLLKVKVTSSDQTLLLNEDIIVGGIGEYRTIQYRHHNTGTCKLNIIVSDGELSTNLSLETQCFHTNNTLLPFVSAISDKTTNVSTPTGPHIFRVADFYFLNDAIKLSAASSNKTLLPTANIQFGVCGSDRTITMTPAAGQTGTTTVTVTAKNPRAYATTFTLTVDGITSVLKQNGAKHIQIIPNPANDYFSLNFNSEISEEATLIVRNVLGEILKTNIVSIYSGENSIPVNSQSLKPGIYFIEVGAGDNKHVEKLIINN